MKVTLICILSERLKTQIVTRICPVDAVIYLPNFMGIRQTSAELFQSGPEVTNPNHQHGVMIFFTKHDIPVLLRPVSQIIQLEPLNNLHHVKAKQSLSSDSNRIMALNDFSHNITKNNIHIVCDVLFL